MQLWERIRYEKYKIFINYKNCNKNLMEKFNSRFNLSEEKTRKLENKSKGNTQNVEQTEKKYKREVKGSRG